MIKTITICDKCGYEEVSNNRYYNENFTDVKLEFGKYDKNYKIYNICKNAKKN